MEYNKDISLRLKKVEGQIRGIQKMLDENRNCMDIIQQLQAIQSAVSSTNQLIIKQYLSNCFKDSNLGSDQEKLNEVSKLFALIKE
jgi:DNA-binding FrmR family transcriptional regulator